MKIEVRRVNGQPSAWWKPRAADHWDKKLGAGNRLEVQLAQWSKYPLQALQALLPGEQPKLNAAVNRLERRIRGIEKTMIELSQMPDNFQLKVRKASRFYDRLMSGIFAFSILSAALDLTTSDRGNLERVVFNLSFLTIPAMSLGHIRKRARTNEMLALKAKEELVPLLAYRRIIQEWAGVSHDMKNILGAIYLASSGGKTVSFVNEAQIRERFAIIYDSAVELGKLIDTMKHLFRPVKLSEEPLPVLDLLSEAIYTFTHLKNIDERRLIVIINSNPDRPMARLDQLKFKQAVLNLLINAFDAIPVPFRGEIEVSAENVRLPQDLETSLGTIPSGDYVRVMVRDNGSGISEELLPKIFDFGETSKGEKGTGIGLTIVKTAVEGHKGFIDIATSQKPQKSGTSFFLYFPC
ncbi:MAG: HAMP domain-containing histidine kinase [Candidatus Margulisbacteria bacterium]|nr:HAMP domain-containing histidine kinase [Candidatus Margulisiibacteriota bacterium]MBU1616570.1 HAMP domain-containing histidine kinase [Candidatus Margulisiibacteriota bacterium]